MEGMNRMEDWDLRDLALIKWYWPYPTSTTGVVLKNAEGMTEVGLKFVTFLI